jgi:hypothetical protein
MEREKKVIMDGWASGLGLGEGVWKLAARRLEVGGWRLGGGEKRVLMT